MRKRLYSQKVYLFITYGTLTLILLCSLFVYFYNYYKSNIYEEARTRSTDICTSVSSFVSNNLDNMSAISMNIVYSNAIRKRFTTFSEKYLQDDDIFDELTYELYESSEVSDTTIDIHNTGSPESEMTDETISSANTYMQVRESIEDINDIITAMIGVFQSASAVNLYTLSGDRLTSGSLAPAAINFSELDWYEPTLALNGHKYITQPIYNNTLVAEGENYGSFHFISLTRMLIGSDKVAEGIVEVVQDCHKLFSLIPELQANNPSTMILVYNEREELIYPYRPENKPQDNYLSYVNSNNLQSLKPEIIQAQDMTGLMITYKQIDKYDWTVITVIPKNDIYSTLIPFRNTFIITLVCGILFILLLCLFISHKLTHPLSSLTKVTKELTLNQVLNNSEAPLTTMNSQISEIAQLCNSFRDMYEKLRSSSQEVMLAHNEETKAKFQATQSLINPHFLYNSLTTISVMAEEEMNENIIEICLSLCDYFRYIASAREMIVPLSQEICYTEKYIKCMSIKFENEFYYSSNIREDTKDLLVPKLIIQPIVENAFKYAYNQSPPPWTLALSTRTENNNWIIEITDNGGCLTDEQKNKLLNEYNNINTNHEYKNLQIGGMGLKNVYIRLKLLYGEQSIFRIENHLPGQTIFVIGGPIYRTEEAYYEQHPKL